jgi:AraC-like DNA-binding protein
MSQGDAAVGHREIAFRHLDLVLATAHRFREPTAAEIGGILNPLRPKPEERRKNAVDVDDIEIARRAACVERPEDPVVKHLSDALAIAEHAHDRHAEIYVDALRLAVAIRLLGLQSEAQPIERGDDEGRAKRSIRGLQKWRLKRVIEYVDDRLYGKITLADLAAVAGLSRMHFASQFRVATGLRPHEYLLRQRIRRADELLRQSTMAIVEVALTVGFQTQAHFTTVFKRFVGCTPLQWRNINYGADRPSR